MGVSYKCNSDGSVEYYNARLVAQGFLQQPGIDYHETFSPVVQPTMVRIVLSFTVSFAWPIRQLDVKNAFLHGVLNEDVFMKQPPGFTNPDYPNHVCKLTKVIYGLKQASGAWFHRFSTFLLTQGFICSKANPSMFIHRSSLDILILLLYMDDIILIGSHSQLLVQFTDRFSHQFAMKDLGDLHYFLGVHVVRNSHDLHLSQPKYIVDLLLKFICILAILFVLLLHLAHVLLLRMVIYFWTQVSMGAWSVCFNI